MGDEGQAFKACCDTRLTAVCDDDSIATRWATADDDGDDGAELADGLVNLASLSLPGVN